MNAGALAFDPRGLTFIAYGMSLSELSPLLDGELAKCGAPQIAAAQTGWTVRWPVQDDAAQAFVLRLEQLPRDKGLLLTLALEGLADATACDSIGLRIGRVEGALRYLRNGYTSWDGSYFVEQESARGVIEADPRALTGYAMTALVGERSQTVVLGFARHDRFQGRLRFAFATGPLSIDVETLIDRVAHRERICVEPLILLAGREVEGTLRRWARHVAAVSTLAPRIRATRISGWCSWYNLYSSIDPAVLREHLQAAVRFRNRYKAPVEIFQIDDGFTPEMGDWLEVKPAFAQGIAPLLAEIRASGFVPGLWIAPFMVGNRSRLYAEHPDWVVKERGTQRPLVPMKFYGEFRWHKRSEEYYVLDITHPEAERYIRKVFQVWSKEWGCGYFKTDFMYFGSEYGPSEAQWHEAGLSRIQVWMRMARLIREEIGEALWLGCGGPIWAPLGLVDAVRIGRDIGVSWQGNYSAESLLRDQTARNFANGIFWQSDPDCILLRDRFHDLTDVQVRSLALFAGLTGGVLMTSDQLDEVPQARAAMFAELARSHRAHPCDFPQLACSPLRHRVQLDHTGRPALISEGDPVLIQKVIREDGVVIVNVFNTGSTPVRRLIPWSLVGCDDATVVMSLEPESHYVRTAAGVEVSLARYTSCVLLFGPVTP